MSVVPVEFVLLTKGSLLPLLSSPVCKRGELINSLSLPLSLLEPVNQHEAVAMRLQWTKGKSLTFEGV